MVMEHAGECRVFLGGILVPLPAVFHGRCFPSLCCSRIAFSFIILGLVLLMSSESTYRQSTWGTFAGNRSIFFNLFFVASIVSSLVLFAWGG